MKTEISKNKIKQILKSYIKENKTSNIILEQSNNVDLYSKLKGMERCFTPNLKATTTTMNGTGDNKYAIRTTGKLGGFRYFFISGKVAQQLPNEGLLYLPDSWNPSDCSPSQQSESYTKQQQSFIDSWKKNNPGAKLEDELRDEEKYTFEKHLASPKNDIFTEDLYMWLPPANISPEDIAASLAKSVTAQIPQTPDACKLLVKTFYQGFKSGTAVSLSPSVIKANAKKVKACRDLFYQKIGRLKGGKKFDDMLNELAQVTSTSPWFVTPERT
jgi:hypothetical protein